jgi:hypothetical protein
VALICGLLAAVASVFGAVGAAALGLPDAAAPYIAVAGLCSVSCLGGAYFVDSRPGAASLAFAIGAAAGLLALNEAATAAAGGTAIAVAVALASAVVTAAAAALATVGSIVSGSRSPRFR